MAKYVYVHRRRSVDAAAPDPEDILVGEIAINTLTGTAYTKNSISGIVAIGGGSDEVSVVTDVIVSGVFILVEKRTCNVSDLGAASYTIVHSGVAI
jgi:hypothetical protein